MRRGELTRPSTPRDGHVAHEGAGASGCAITAWHLKKLYYHPLHQARKDFMDSPVESSMLHAATNQSLSPVVFRDASSPSHLPPVQWSQQTREAAVTLYYFLKEWTHRYPALATSRNGQSIIWSSLLASYTFDGIVDDAAREFAKQCLALITHDDVMDDRADAEDPTFFTSLADSCSKAIREPEGFTRITTNGHSSRSSQVIAAFADCMGGPAQRSRSEEWRKVFIDILDRSVKSHLWERDQLTPTLAQHLENGIYTAGTAVPMLSAAMTSAPTGVSTAEKDRYLSACLDACWCIRVTNDIAGLEEDQRCKEVNAVVLSSSERGLNEVQVTQELITETRRKITYLSELADDPHHPLARQYGWCARSTMFHVNWYMTKSGYSFTAQDWLDFGETDVAFARAMRRASTSTGEGQQ